MKNKIKKMFIGTTFIPTEKKSIYGKVNIQITDNIFEEPFEMNSLINKNDKGEIDEIIIRIVKN